MRLFFALVCLAVVAGAGSAAAAIVSASPNPVDAGGPAFTLTVTVSAFVQNPVIKWSGTPLTTTNVNDTTLSATVPATLIAICGKYSITVTGNDGVVSNSYAIIVNPVLQSLSPSVLPAGTAGANVTGTGLGFSSNVYLTLITSSARTSLPTTVSGSTTSLSAVVPASALNGLSQVSLFVADPTTGAVSQTLPITLTFASIQLIQPNTVYKGIASCNLPAPACFTLGVGGANFVDGAQVLFNGAPLATRIADSTVLFATVTAALMHDADPDNGAGIQVKNPGAAAPSNAIKLAVLKDPLGTTVTGISPLSTLAGGPGLTLTVNGERFVQGSTIVWVTTALPTTFVSSTQLTAPIAANLIANEGVARITVTTPGATVSNFTDFPIVVASPTISSISPTSATAGGPAFTLTVNGDGFILASQVTGLAGATTTYVSQKQLTASVPASAIATVGSNLVRVQNPGSIFSPQVPVFAVNAPTPAITSISPASVVAGGLDFTLTVNGSNFLSGASVAWNGTALPTTRVSATQLTAQVGAALIAASGTAKITVFNEGPVSSNELVLPISSNATASLASLNPSAAVPGGAAFTLTVTGSGFTAKSTVQWNASGLATTFVSATQLTARVPASLIAAAGTASITVAGDGGPSNALAFTIANQPPTTSAAGIVNAASSLPAIAPGALIAIYGSNLAASTAQAAATPLPVLLGDTSVAINGTQVPLLFVSPGQVNAQVPYETKTGTAKLAVKSNGLEGPAVNFEVAATGPGVFTPQQSNHILALNLADGTLNAPQTPARPGQYVTAYLTGQGLVAPPVTTGDVAPANPFSLPVAPVLVKIGGVPATVQFAGLAPGFIGLLQMNVLIPDVPAGEKTFEVSAGGVAAAPTVISVGARQ